MNALVSVIIPNYNHSLFLKQRIESVLNQSFQDFELIILDDCSTDESRNVIEQYRGNEKVAHIVYNEVNSGSTFKQWKKGLGLATGKYVWVAESDDYADQFFLESSITVLENDDSIGLIQSQSKEVNANNEVKGIWDNEQKVYNWNTDFKENGEVFIKKGMLFSNPIVNASAVVFRHSLLSEDIFDETFKLNGDWLIYTKILKKSDFYNLGTPLNYFRQHGGKGSSGNIKNYNNIKEYAHIIDFIFHNLNLEAKDKDTVRYVFLVKWISQANNKLGCLLKNKFADIAPIAFKNDYLFLFRLLKIYIRKSLS
ncbi:glycosyltransferase [Dysgonomonas sp. 216]|uniref:glycosyltransferase family 2 protein n=1 Tax=Dysgonomonas sp. 216 TaxID=2302934 RepID=UPI0013D3A5A2|nr:glycosyltransferase [Dysgonomonas sp. 216]NDW17543.1 glycosyltransferase [Dysgonomonas sp. 216]